jgi:hypothetical protein
MIRYWQKAISGAESYCESEASRATHFSVNGGTKNPIAEMTENIEQSDTEPLDIPVMNFGEKTDNDGDVPLKPPSLF